VKRFKTAILYRNCISDCPSWTVHRTVADVTDNHVNRIVDVNRQKSYGRYRMDV
jgi:hypothetical protein